MGLDSFALIVVGVKTADPDSLLEKLPEYERERFRYDNSILAMLDDKETYSGVFRTVESMEEEQVLGFQIASTHAWAARQLDMEKLARYIHNATLLFREMFGVQPNVYLLPYVI